MRSTIAGLCLLLAGCEISPVEARSMDWELETAAPAAKSPPPERERLPAAPPPLGASVASAAPPPSSPPRDPGACGAAGGRPCPLQAMMRGSAQASVVRGDFAAIERAFARIGGLAPAGYDGWAEISARGAQAARDQDLVAAKAACSSCHGAFRDKYRASSLRSKALP